MTYILVSLSKLFPISSLQSMWRRSRYTTDIIIGNNFCTLCADYFRVVFSSLPFVRKIHRRRNFNYIQYSWIALFVSTCEVRVILFLDFINFSIDLYVLDVKWFYRHHYLFISNLKVFFIFSVLMIFSWLDIFARICLILMILPLSTIHF